MYLHIFLFIFIMTFVLYVTKGVPVLTRGDVVDMGGRVTSSILTTLELPFLIAKVESLHYSSLFFEVIFIIVYRKLMCHVYICMIDSF
jgi:hypothetical protein